MFNKFEAKRHFWQSLFSVQVILVMLLAACEPTKGNSVTNLEGVVATKVEGDLEYFDPSYFVDGRGERVDPTFTTAMGNFQRPDGTWGSEFSDKLIKRKTWYPMAVYLLGDYINYVCDRSRITGDLDSLPEPINTLMQDFPPDMRKPESGWKYDYYECEEVDN